MHSFPVDEITLSAVEHALGATLSWAGDDEYGNAIFKNIGSDYSLDQLLDFLSGYDKGKEVEIEPGVVEYPDSVYHYTDVIRALISEVRRLRGTKMTPEAH